jgi:hypothetical protein
MFGTINNTSKTINTIQSNISYEYGATWIITNFNNASITKVDKDNKNVYISFKSNNKEHRILVNKEGITEEY